MFRAELSPLPSPPLASCAVLLEDILCSFLFQNLFSGSFISPSMPVFCVWLRPFMSGTYSWYLFVKNKERGHVLAKHLQSMVDMERRRQGGRA